MKKTPITILFLIFSFVCKSEIAFNEIDYMKVGKSLDETEVYEPLVYSTDKFEIYLTNFLCHEDENNPIIPPTKTIKSSIGTNIPKLEELSQKFEAVLTEILGDKSKASSIVQKTYPIKYFFSIDGNEKCSNAVAFGSEILIPLVEDSNTQDYFMGILSHELGHTIEEHIKSNFENYSEFFADVISLLIQDEYTDFMGRAGQAEEFEKSVCLENIARTDKEKFLDLVPGLIPEFVERSLWQHSFSCSTRQAERDFRHKTKEFHARHFVAAADSIHNNSCILMNSLFENIPKGNERETLLAIAKTYIEKDSLFYHPNPEFVLSSLLGKRYEKDLKEAKIAPELIISNDMESDNFNINTVNWDYTDYKSYKRPFTISILNPKTGGEFIATAPYTGRNFELRFEEISGELLEESGLPKICIESDLKLDIQGVIYDVQSDSLQTFAQKLEIPNLNVGCYEVSFE